jgi:hypothetical protein
VVTVEEMQELLLAWEEELTRTEKALATREEKVRISKKAVTQVSAALDVEWAKVKATRQEYLVKIQVHTDRCKQVLDLNKMLGEGKEELDRTEWDLEGSIPGIIVMSWCRSLSFMGFFRTPRRTVSSSPASWQPWWGTCPWSWRILVCPLSQDPLGSMHTWTAWGRPMSLAMAPGIRHYEPIIIVIVGALPAITFCFILM